jgi:hypothetical protein
LKRAGAAKVWVVTAAKAQPESVLSTAQHDAGRQDADGVAMWDAVPAQVIAPEVGKRVSF